MVGFPEGTWEDLAGWGSVRTCELLCSGTTSGIVVVVVGAFSNEIMVFLFLI